MAKSMSDTYPSQFAKSRGKTLFRWDIVEQQVTDPTTGKTRTQYVYDEVAIEGKVTKGKVLAAMRAAELEQDDSDIGDVAAQYTNARAKLKATKVKILPVPQLSEAVALILDYLGIEYNRAA